MAQTTEQALEKLKRSRFRSSFRLVQKDLDYIKKNGLDAVERHAIEIIHARLAPAMPEKDGKQTPFKGHPVFKAQHATACCCRGCLEKWYKVRKGTPLTAEQEMKIVKLLMAWITRQLTQNGMP